MTAPLPMRFSNPIKELCQKANLDYETVISGTTTTLRNALVNADIETPIHEYTEKEKKLVKQKISEYNDKYGIHGRDVEERDGKITVKDKGIERYTMGVDVEYICTDDSKVDESATSSTGETNHQFTKDGIKYLTNHRKWVPGRPDSCYAP
jgi:hypothetical protein